MPKTTKPRPPHLRRYDNISEGLSILGRYRGCQPMKWFGPYLQAGPVCGSSVSDDDMDRLSELGWLLQYYHPPGDRSPDLRWRYLVESTDHSLSLSAMLKAQDAELAKLKAEFARQRELAQKRINNLIQKRSDLETLVESLQQQIREHSGQPDRGNAAIRKMIRTAVPAPAEVSP